MKEFDKHKKKCVFLVIKNQESRNFKRCKDDIYTKRTDLITIHVKKQKRKTCKNEKQSSSHREESV